MIENKSIDGNQSFQMSQIDTNVSFIFYVLYNDGGQDGCHNSNNYLICIGKILLPYVWKT